ncbi:MAG: hypothetical protein ACODAA_02090 [Gemmatimonadota bacterium]
MKLFSRTTRDGFVVGLIAYFAVALFYAVFDFLAGRGFVYTVNMLGKAVFRGVRDRGVLLFPSTVDIPAMLWYNLFHLAAALVIGLVVMALVERAERRPAQAGGVLFLLVAGFFVTVAGVGWLSAPIRPVLPWWSIVVANVLAVLAAAVYIVRRRPGIVSRLLPFGRGGEDSTGEIGRARPAGKTRHGRTPAPGSP